MFDPAAVPATVPYQGAERRINPQICLTAEQIEGIVDAAAAKAADLAIAKITQHAYEAIGKSIVSKFLWILGMLMVAGISWAIKNGVIEL